MANKIYGGVSGAGANLVTDLYGGSNSGAQRITKLYGSVTTTTINTAVGTVREGGAGNVAALAGRGFVDKINTISLPSYALSYLGLRYDGAYFNLTLSFSDGTPTETLTGWVDEPALLEWGIVFWSGTPSIGTDYIDLTITSSTSSKTKIIHQGFGHLNYLMLSSVTGSIVPWAGEGINVGSFNGNTFYTKLSADFPQFLPYSYCDAPIYRLKMVLKSTNYPYLADLILQFGEEGNIVAEEILENDVRPSSVFDDYGIDVNGGGGNVGAASYINLNPIYN